MPGWLGALLFFGVIFAVLTLWDKLKESNGAAGRAARAASDAADTASNAVGIVVMRVAGVVFMLLGAVGVVLLFTDGFAWWRLGGLLLAAYGVYLLMPGHDKWLFF